MRAIHSMENGKPGVLFIQEVDKDTEPLVLHIPYDELEPGLTQARALAVEWQRGTVSTATRSRK